MTYFDLMGKLGMEFLHPGGKASTEMLIKELEPGMTKKILEIGCGTGATAVSISKRFKPYMVAVDASESMLRAAKQRAFISFGLGKIDFVKVDRTGKLPFSDASFDAVYSESVIGVSGESCIPVLMSEISRVLKPGGRLVCNDAIWNQHANREEIEYLTNLGLRDFGFSVCSSKPAYLNEWIDAYKAAGLSSVKVYPIDTITPADNYAKRSLYTYYRKFMSRISPSVRKQKKVFDQWENKHHRTDVSMLDGFMFVLEKKAH